MGCDNLIDFVYHQIATNDFTSPPLTSCHGLATGSSPWSKTRENPVGKTRS